MDRWPLDKPHPGDAVAPALAEGRTLSIHGLTDLAQPLVFMQSPCSYCPPTDVPVFLLLLPQQSLGIVQGLLDFIPDNPGSTGFS